MKYKYITPMAEKQVFDYSDTVTASGNFINHGDQGHGLGHGGGCDHIPGHGNSKKPHQ